MGQFKNMLLTFCITGDEKISAQELGDVLDAIEAKLTPVGMVVATARNTPPSGWLSCEGQVLNITEYSALAAAIGNTYGGDGLTTFALPDLRGRFPLGASASRSVGATGGEETVTLGVNEMPSHSHSATINFGGDNNQSNVGAGNVLASEVKAGFIGPTIYQNGPIVGALRSDATTVSTVGGGQAHNNMPPFTVLGYMIYTGK